MKTLKLTSPYMKTPEVFIVQSKVGVKADGEYGPLTATAVKAWKWRFGYPTDHINRQVTASDYAYMTGRYKQTKLMKLRQISRRRRFPEKFGLAYNDVQERALADAKKDVGLTERPSGSNVVPTLVAQAKAAGVEPNEIAPMGYAWCAFYANLKARRAGAKNAVSTAGMSGGDPWPLYVPWIWQWAQDGKHGLRAVSWKEARPGDWVIFNWDGGVVDHIGILDYVVDSQTVRTVEGNTSFDNSGSQSNGGAVAARTRYRPDVVGFVRWS